MKLKLILIGLFILVAGVFIARLPDRKVPLESLAERIINKCKSYDPTEVCYDTEIPKLMKFLSMEDTFTVTSLVQNRDQTFPYCHVLGHKLASYETKKNPDAWRDVVARCPSGVCSNGCVHGAFQEKYKDEVLTAQNFSSAKSEFVNLCEESDGLKLTGLTQGSCYHALGHLLMYVTGADIDKSVATCDEVAKKQDGRNFSNLCYDGAFMQIFQPLDTDDKSLVSKFVINRNNAWSFCKKFTGEKRNSCWHESWPIFLTQITMQKGLVDFCSNLDANSQDACFNDMFYIMPIQFRFNSNNIDAYCSGFAKPLQEKCFAMVASRLLEIDKGNIKRVVDYCTQLSDTNSDYCFKQIIRDANFDFLPKSKEIADFCSIIPTKWQSSCINNK